MTTAAPRWIETTNSAGQKLRVTFVWMRDRFAHTIAVVDGTRLIPLLASADDGGEQAAWPNSPPLQQLSMETSPAGGPMALLVGMASGNHWSASVEPFGNEAAIVFDVALRAATQPAFAGSGYRAMFDARIADTKTAEIANASMRCQLSLADEFSTRWELSSDGLRLRNDAIPERFPATFRWKYVVRLP